MPPNEDHHARRVENFVSMLTLRKFSLRMAREFHSWPPATTAAVTSPGFRKALRFPVPPAIGVAETIIYRDFMSLSALSRRRDTGI